MNKMSFGISGYAQMHKTYQSKSDIMSHIKQIYKSSGLISNRRKIINLEYEVDKSYLLISLIGFSHNMNTYQPYFDGIGYRTNDHA